MYGVLSISTEPPVKRAIAFFDGQNLFHAAKRAFGYPTELRTHGPKPDGAGFKPH
jgi:hypothetical protein